MLLGRRSPALSLLAFLAAGAVLAACVNPESGSPPTGKGQDVGVALLLVFFVPWMALGWLLLRLHRRWRSGAGRPPWPVWVVVCWCFGAALFVGWLGGWLLIGTIDLATGGIFTRGGDVAFTEQDGWLVVIFGSGTIGGAYLLAWLGLSVRRGADWSRWTTLTISVPLSAYLAYRTTGYPAQGGDPHYFWTAVTSAVLAAVPIPFLVWPGTGAHFAPRRVVPPPPLAEPTRSSADRSLNDRWHTFGR